MIPSLPQLWLATVYVLAVAVAIQRWNSRGETYVGRHRPGLGAFTYVPPDWREEFEGRIAAELRAYRHGSGAGRYAHLRTDELDAKAERDRALTDMGLVLRSPWAETADVT
jgi:hypothetical protein